MDINAIAPRLNEWLNRNKKSRSTLAKELGMPQTTINKYLKDYSSWGGMTAVFLYNILKTYPEIDANWLMRGNGVRHLDVTDDIASPSIPEQMGVCPVKSSQQPYYDVDFCGGFDVMINDQTIKPTSYISTPGGADNVIWCNLTGHSMEPTISHGDMIALKEVKDPRYLPLGEIYAIVTEDYRTVKRIGKAEQEGFIKLIPDNKAGEYEAQEIPLETIIKMYSVCGCIKRM